MTDVKVSPPLGLAINALGPRSAMGLPESYMGPDWQTVRASSRQLAGLASSSLATIAEDPAEPFERRYAAGLLLALLGDPRIRCLDPPMCYVPGGRYSIGLDLVHLDAVTAEFKSYGVLREWIQKEVPRHQIDLDGYRIGKYPVTNAEYRTFVGDSGHLPLPTDWTFGTVPPGRDNLPVSTIRPEDAESYCAWLSAQTGRRFRLPSEAEWEVAAAGAAGNSYPWGDDFYADHANTVESGILVATPVGIFPKGQSAFGVMDMAGNVEEYVADDYSPYSGGCQINDDLRAERGAYRVARGGSFTRYRDLARCQRRHGWYNNPIYVMGFRIAETT